MKPPKKYITFAEVNDKGIPHAYDRQSVLDFLAMHPGRRVEVTYNILKKNDSYGQRMRYYRGVIITWIQKGLVGKGIRLNGEQTHDFLRQNSSVANIYYDIGENGKGYQDTKSTADFDGDEWHDYINECIEFALMELGITIPEPTYEITDLTK